ncbi:hypothetical protein N7450_001796 [Penicillium hetheringtonii]|uniref:Altered inheritance of mitochondria protein 9, mitochondrial n=1 Tax=Penicillium hetheringtonii TaxID=911720 RepID=A0AAD6E5A2_9EURO|nr:hypothetical protein N7450_001796 [Penicillium hetheringtonii]
MSIDSRIYNTAVPTLFHPDLHKRNIFMSEDDSSTITGIIDWQSSSVEPAFWYADEVPDFATCPSSSGSPAQKEDKSDLCAEVYKKDGASAFRHELIQTLKDWQTLGFSGSYPLSMPIPEDTDLHQKEYKHFEAAQNLKHDLSNLLDTTSDGWVPTEDWEAAKTENRAMFSGMLQAVLENKDPDKDKPIRNKGDLREIWPFDLPEES